jgi:hypothetical protein
LLKDLNRQQILDSVRCWLLALTILLLSRHGQAKERQASKLECRHVLLGLGQSLSAAKFLSHK